jgi:hypothetical protein
MSTAASFWRTTLGPVQGALRLYWPAFVGLQIFSVLLVVGYYAGGPVRDVAQGLLGWKEKGGLLFVVAANIFSGAVLPEMLKARLRPPGRPGPTWGDGLHLAGLMAIFGVAVDTFYRWQGWWFADFSGATAVALKILVDQLGYSLFFAMPFVVVWFAWKEHGYCLRSALAALGPAPFLKRLGALFVPNVIFWVPALVALYALPTELQFLLFVFLNGAWCLLMVFIARETSGAAAEGVRPGQVGRASGPT